MHSIEKYAGRDTYIIASQTAYFRKLRGLTQEQLGKMCGTTQEGISRLESTPDGKWTATTLNKIAGALDVKVSVDIVPNEKR